LFHIFPDGRDPRIDHLLKGLAPVFYATVPTGRYGLSLFFTLSSYLICELLLREREATGTIGVKQFYIRRILRIWPLYYLGLALGVAVALLPGGDHGDIAEIAWFACFMGSRYTALHGWTSNPIFPLWSISVEEQFYLFAPWIMKFFNRKSLCGLCATLIVVANARLYFLGTVAANDSYIWSDSLVHFECFAVGILLCLAVRSRVCRIAIWQRLLLIAAGWSCWLYACDCLHSNFEYASANPGSWSLMGGYALGALGASLMLLASLGTSPKLLPRRFIYLGRISYGLYVYHEFAIYITTRFILRQASRIEAPILLLKISIELGLTILMAALSYRFFETPFLKMKNRHEVIKSEPILDAGS